MGNITSQTQDDIKLYLQHDFEIINYPYLINKKTNKSAIVHQLTTDNADEAQNIRKDVQVYKKLNCQFINKIVQYIPLESSKICSQQQFHYIVEEDFCKYNLKQQFLARKYYKENFSSTQILEIIKTYCCGLQIYHDKMNRRFLNTLSLQNLIIDEQNSNQLRLNDPILSQNNINIQKLLKSSKSHSTSSIQSFKPSGIVSIYEAPEKQEAKNTKFNESTVQFDSFLVDLYVVGIIGLQLNRMDFYQQNEIKEVISNQLKIIKNQDLKKSLQILTSTKANERLQIYQFLDIDSKNDTQFSLQNIFKNGKINKTKGIEGQYQGHNNLTINRHSTETNSNNLNSVNLYSSQNSYSFGVSSNVYKPQIINQNIPINQPTISYYKPQNITAPMYPLPSFNNTSNFTNFSNNTNFNSHTTNTMTIRPQSNSQNFSNSQTINYNFNNTPITSNNITSLSKPNEPVSYSNSNYASLSKLPNLYLPSINNSLTTVTPLIRNDSSATKLSVLYNDGSVGKIANTAADYSPFRQLKDSELGILSKSELINNKKNQNKEISQLSESNYQQYFDKHSHLHYDALSPNTANQKRQITQQMQKLLKNSKSMEFNSNDTPSSPHQNLYSLTASPHEIDKRYTNNNFNTNSGQHFISETQLIDQYNMTLKKQRSIIQKIQEIPNSPKNNTSFPLALNPLPAYRPNKQVEEILRKLGIGSLLYENVVRDPILEVSSKLEESHEYVTTKQTITLDINGKSIEESNYNNFSINDKNDVFVHTGAYGVKMNKESLDLKTSSQITSSNSLEQFVQRSATSSDITASPSFSQQLLLKQSQQDQDNRQTTSYRKTIPHNKYNATIVQVGDQDSQYSDSQTNSNQKPSNSLSNNIVRQQVVQQYETGSRYEGQKRNGKRDGNGRFYYQDGGFYQGQWKDNKMDGQGKLYYQGGKLAYEGYWKEDEFHGQGKVYNDNPKQLNNLGFDFTNFDMLEDYWEYYEGNLVKDTKQGRGKIKLTNGQLFEGDFQNDRIHGFGKFFMLEGNVIQGIWRDSRLIKIIQS